jgi:hypothetical protein
VAHPVLLCRVVFHPEHEPPPHSSRTRLPGKCKDHRPCLAGRRDDVPGCQLHHEHTAGTRPPRSGPSGHTQLCESTSHECCVPLIRLLWPDWHRYSIHENIQMITCHLQQNSTTGNTHKDHADGFLLSVLAQEMQKKHSSSIQQEHDSQARHAPVTHKSSS